MGSCISGLKSNSRLNVCKKHRPLPIVPDLVPLPKLSNGDYNNDIKFEPYYFGNISRYEAEELLFLPETLDGAFIIRDTFNTTHKYSLSVRYGDGVRHFRIQQLIDGRYFVVRRKTFSTLNELIQYYVKTAFLKPYVQAKKPITKKKLRYSGHFCVANKLVAEKKTLMNSGTRDFIGDAQVIMPDIKCANNGTLNYIALDGHLGMHTRRGDLESLMYNGLEWLKIKLPWTNFTIPKTIKSKTEMKDTILATGSNKEKNLFNNVPNCYFETMISIYNLEPTEKPNYALLKNLLNLL